MSAFGGNIAPYPPVQNGKQKRGGLMLPADKVKLDAASAGYSASNLVSRDAGGGTTLGVTAMRPQVDALTSPVLVGVNAGNTVQYWAINENGTAPGLRPTGLGGTDAAGWDWVYDNNSKRRFRRRYLNQAAPASAEAAVVSGIPLPTGFATFAAFDRFFTWTTVTAGTGGTAPQRFILLFRTNEASTTGDILGYSVTGVNMNTLMGAINCFIELVER